MTNTLWTENITATAPCTSEHGFNSFELLGEQFGAYHKNPTNIFLHFITTPIGILGALSLLRYATNSCSSLVALSGIYLLSLLPVVPNGVFLGTALLCCVIVMLARKLELNVVSSMAFVVFGYILQDLSHMGTGEKSFQSTYTEGGGHVGFSFAS